MHCTTPWPGEGGREGAQKQSVGVAGVQKAVKEIKKRKNTITTHKHTHTHNEKEVTNCRIICDVHTFLGHVTRQSNQQESCTGRGEREVGKM